MRKSTNDGGPRAALLLVLLAVVLLPAGGTAFTTLTVVTSNCEVVNTTVTELLCPFDLASVLLDIDVTLEDMAPYGAFIQSGSRTPCELVEKRGLSRHTVSCPLPKVGAHRLTVELRHSIDGIRVVSFPLLVSPAAGPSLPISSSSRQIRQASVLSVEELDSSCVHGVLDDNGVCQCDFFFAGADCSVPCPGLRVDDCSDTGCYGATSAQCGESCSWSTVLNLCTGMNSCIENVCSGKGTCSWGNTGDASCQCTRGYYGKTCETYCTAMDCKNTYAIESIVCSSDGACTCSGNYGTIPNLCTDCKDGWYGVDCSKTCPCSGKGSCDQLSGECTCFEDSTHGFWTGPSCTECKDGYIGYDCREKNLVLGPGTKRKVIFPEHYTFTNFVPDVGALLTTTTSHLRIAYGSTAAHCTPNDSASSEAGTLTCAQTVVSGTLCDARLRGTSVSYLSVEPTVNTTAVRILNESSGTSLSLTEAGNWSLPALVEGQVIVAAQLSRKNGWVVVLSDGSVASANSPVYSTPPSDQPLAVLSAAISEGANAVYIVGSQSGGWVVYTFSLTAYTFTVFASASTVGGLQEYTAAVAVGVQSDMSLAVALTNDTAVAFVQLSSPPNGRAYTSLVSLKTEEFSHATMKIGSDGVLYLIAHTAVGVRIYTAQWSERRVASIQLVTDGVQGSKPWQPLVSLMANPGVLVLTSQPDAMPDVELRTYSSFVVKAVTPLTVDHSGGAELTITGRSFLSPVNCLFSEGSTAAATVINSTTAVCVTPFLQSTHVFAEYEVEMLAYVPWLCLNCSVASANHATINGFATPTPRRAYGPNNESYTSIHSTEPIYVECLGAPNLDTLHCRFEDSAGMQLISAASFITAELVKCQVPAVTRPSSGSTGRVALSFGGSVFSTGIPFTFVGDAAALKIVSVQSVAVAAQAQIELPTVLIRVVDNESHPLYELDRTRVVNAMALWFNSTRKELDTFISAYQSVVLSTYSNQTKLGESSFDVSLQYPRVGVGMLAFSSSGLQRAVLPFSVSEGEPATMTLAVKPEPQVDNLHDTMARQPVIVFRDIAENTVYDLTTGGVPVTDVAVVFNKGTSLVTTQATRNRNGYFEFADVHTSGLFGRTYELVFSSPGFANLTSPRATVADCYPDQYATYGTTYCLACPAKAICNGSYSFNLTDGVWKGGELAYTVLKCPLEDACVKGQCARGYTGPLCTTCSSGYGKSGVLCKRCYSMGANIVIVVLAAIMYLLFLFGLVVLLHQMAGPHFRSMQVLLVALNFVQIAAVIVYPLPELPMYMNDFSTFLKIVGFCNVLRLASFTCLGLNAYSLFIVTLVVPFAVVPIFRAVLWEADKINNRHFRKLEEERRILRSFVPYESPEAYYTRITFLGLDDEPAFRTDNSSSIEKLEVQKDRIRQAYAMLDKNSSAFTAISQMAHSKARETALRTLTDERDELLTILRRYEGLISQGSRGGRGAKPPSTLLLSPQMHELSAYGPDGQPGGGCGRGSAGLNDTVTDLDTTRASCLSTASHLTVGSRGVHSEEGEITKGPGSTQDVSGGGERDEKAINDDPLLVRFPELTTTQLTLFGERESFNPIRQNINFSRELELEEERNVTRVTQPVATGLTFVWPPMPHKTVFLLVTSMYYLFNVVVANSFALARCTNINYGIVSRDNTREEERSVLHTDYAISCDTKTHAAYRIAGIVAGSVYGGGLVLFLFFVFLTRRRNDRLARFLALALDLQPRRGWWAGAIMLEKFTLVVISVLVGGYVGAIVSFWVLSVFLLVFMQVQPMSSPFMYRTEICSRTLSIVIASLQLLPFLDSGDEQNDTAGDISGAFLVTVFCCAVAAFVVLAVVELISPKRLWQLLARGVKRLGYTKVCEQDSPDDRRDNDGSAELCKADVERAPFSFDVYNALLVSEHFKPSGSTAQENRSILDHQMNALLRQRSSSLSGRTKTMTSVWLTGVAAVGAVSNVELLADFIDNSEAYVEKPKELQRELEKYTTDPLASIHNLEKEMVWEQLVLLEHAQQLDGVVSRLTQIAQSGPGFGTSMSKKAQ